MTSKYFLKKPQNFDKFPYMIFPQNTLIVLTFYNPQNQDIF